MAQGNNYVNNAANNLISINQSAPKPKKKKSTLTRWRSSKDVDLSYISSPRNNDKNKKQSTKITFLSTNYDTRMNVDKEENDIKNSNFEFKRSILTISDLENVLIESPPIVHISSHGFHKYKTDKHKAFQIALEEPKPLRYLIDNHPKLSAYYATIAILFEMEINYFIQYGFKKSLKNQPLITSIWKDDILLSNDKIYNILVNILDRFGCSYMYNTASKCIEIFWGEYNNNLQFISQPYTPMNSYQLSTLYQHDQQVQKILNAILYDYNQYDMNRLKEYQKFSWPILIDHILDYTPNENISFDNISEDTNDIDADEIEAFMSIDVDEKDRTAFVVDRLTKMKFGINQDLTREIKIIPLNEKTEEQVSIVKHEIIHSLKQIPDIQINFEAVVSKRIHIIRFVNEYALVLAEQKMNEMRINDKYNHEYNIQFRDMSKADVCTQKHVGFIAETQEKIYSIDIKNKTDPISKMLKKYLKSKEECKIKLLVLNGCHSYILGKIFGEYVENVICIHPFVKILDKTATTFTKYFYESLQKYINPRILFSHSVLQAYNIAKINISKQCSNDFACVSHSHLHPITYYHNKYIQQTIKLKQSHQVIHFNENWKLLQNHINNQTLFEQYRNRIKDSCVIMEEPIDNLYDNKTLIISNISEREMNEIKTYLERYKPTINEDEKQQFVEKCVYQSNEYYPELSVAYFKFKTLVDINEAKKILSQKIYDEEIVFSDQMLKSYLKCNLNKIEQYENIDNLGWIYRTVPRCCCSPFYPHIAMDKLILLQNGNIVNRGPINSKSQIKNGLHKIRIRQQQKSYV